MKKICLYFCALLFAVHHLVGEEGTTNVVLFLVDDMGWMDSEPYGSEYYETPNMSRLADLSMRFTDAYAVPLCSPSRATILTGQYTSRHGVTSASGHQPPAKDGASPYPEEASVNSRFIYANSKNFLDPGITNLAEVLGGAGYRTGHFGKWHLGTSPEHRPNAQGFESTWFCVPDPGPPSYFSPYGVNKDGKAGGQHKVGNITDGPDGEYITDRLTDEALKFLERHQDEPFFLNLWQYGVHGPWGHKEEYTAEFAKKEDPRGHQRNPIMASMLKSVDDSLGRVLDKLDELGLTENTLFIFYSDNGGNAHSNTPDSKQMTAIKPGHPKYPSVEDWKKWAGPEAPTNNAPLREGKARIYEGGQRVPLMVRLPGQIVPGSVSDAVVGPMDLYPTILEVAGVEAPGDHIIDGLSILPVLEQKGELDREAIFTWFPHLVPAVSVRAGDWKLIYRWEPRGDYPELRELYDLSKDIGETNNLAKAHPEKVTELETLIEQFMDDTGALAPKPNPDFNEAQAMAVRAPDWGLLPKQCETEVIEGALRVTPTGETPFLGTAQVKLNGPITLKMRMKSADGGSGQIQWRTAQQDGFPEEGQRVKYTVAGGSEWEEVTVEIPVKGMSGTIRLYLPGSAMSTEFEMIEFLSGGGAKKAWSFGE
ncbi:MAG: sulfatase [Verrucomicrobiales bacterium]|nr:sulfatase [Verrucomicrobiales bacterium]